MCDSLINLCRVCIFYEFVLGINSYRILKLDNKISIRLNSHAAFFIKHVKTFTGLHDQNALINFFSHLFTPNDKFYTTLPITRHKF